MDGPQRRRNSGLLIGSIIGLAALIVLLLPGQEALHVRGPMNTGHDEVRCEHCHRPAPGTLRQQLQTKVRYLIGLRSAPADFGLQRVGNDRCLDCHDRPDDRHPVFRFTEPRFAEARAKLHPELCVSCHLEHRGVRVTLDRFTYCENCHKETRLKKDPVDISHEELITLKRWESCLGCHDFHGNHVMKTRRVVKEAVPAERILAYFKGGSSPYSETKHRRARKEPRS